MKISPLAGKPVPPAMLVDVPRPVSAHYTEVPDPAIPGQQVAFSTSGHRGSAFLKTFNERHVLAITEAICRHRAQQAVDGSLFLGIDTHALPVPACASALEVLAANSVDVMPAEHDEYMPTPAVSLAILTHNRGRTAGLADGIVVTPSHNPPEDGGFKYNPPHGGPADTGVTGWIEAAANRLLKRGLRDVKRVPVEHALRAGTTHWHDYLNVYVNDLGGEIDIEAIPGATIRLDVDPLGGAGVHYWVPIAERFGLNLTIVSETADPTFEFMTVDWDGRIRMDPSSPYAMQRLIGLKDRFDIAAACDTDHDRHGIVTRSSGLLPPDHYLAVAIHHLFPHRPQWRADAGVGKPVVSSGMTREFGEPVSDLIEAPATPAQKQRLSALSPQQVRCTHLAGETVRPILSHAPGNDAPIGGVKVIADGGWFAARPSGTEAIYKMYAESFRGPDHLRRIVEEAQAIGDSVLRGGTGGAEA